MNGLWCAPIGIRTPNLLIRSQMLYPIELWARRTALKYGKKRAKATIILLVQLHKRPGVCIF